MVVDTSFKAATIKKCPAPVPSSMSETQNATSCEGSGTATALRYVHQLYASITPSEMKVNERCICHECVYPDCLTTLGFQTSLKGLLQLLREPSPEAAPTFEHLEIERFSTACASFKYAEVNRCFALPLCDHLIALGRLPHLKVVTVHLLISLRLFLHSFLCTWIMFHLLKIIHVAIVQQDFVKAYMCTSPHIQASIFYIHMSFYIYAHARMLIHGRVYIFLCICVCMCVCMYVCMYERIHACMYVCVCMCVYVCTYICMYACMHAGMYACMYVCI